MTFSSTSFPSSVLSPGYSVRYRVYFSMICAVSSLVRQDSLVVPLLLSAWTKPPLRTSRSRKTNVETLAGTAILIVDLDGDEWEREKSLQEEDRWRPGHGRHRYRKRNDLASEGELSSEAFDVLMLHVVRPRTA